MADWGFYGRAQALDELSRIVSGGRWFFCRIEGRRLDKHLRVCDQP